MHKNILSRPIQLSLFLLALIFSLLQGCAAEKQKSATIHQTLKGDNSTVKAMSGEMQLPDSGFSALSGVTDAFAGDLEKAVGPQKVFLDRSNFRDAQTRDVSNFSIFLENELDASLSDVFELVSDPTRADYLIGAVYQEYGNVIRVFFKYRDQEMSQRKSLDYYIERLKLPADSLKENLHSKAYQLAANIIPDSDELQLYINPLNLDSCNCVTDFSRSFTALIRSEIVRVQPDVQVCMEKPEESEDLGRIRRKAGEIKKLESADAVFAGADTILEGTYFVNGDTVLIDLLLKDLDGKILHSASIDIDRDLIHSRIDNPEAEILSEKGGKRLEKTNGKTAQVVNITTIRGSGDPVFRAGETITFLLQTQKPLYFYIYDFNSRDEVALLYPYDRELDPELIYPGTLIAVPAETDGFELEVKAPFGRDLVKVFATPVKLPIPQLSRQVRSMSYGNRQLRAIGGKQREIQQNLSRQHRINPDDLVDYYRGAAREFDIDLFEDSLIIETIP